MKKLLVVSLLSTVALLVPRARGGPGAVRARSSDVFRFHGRHAAGAEAQAELKKLKALLCPKGCGKLFVFANATAPQSATATDGRGASKIVYSPRFLASVRKSYGPLGSFGLFAHQLGHHLDAIGNRPAWMKEAWDGELSADAWAGCAMAKAELKPSGLQAALLVLSEYPSPRHPAWGERRAAITEGYKQCGGACFPRWRRSRPRRRRPAPAPARSPAPRRFRVHQRQRLPQRPGVRAEPVRRRARATPVRQGHRLPRPAGVRRHGHLRRPRRAGARAAAAGRRPRGRCCAAALQTETTRPPAARAGSRPGFVPARVRRGPQPVRGGCL